MVTCARGKVMFNILMNWEELKAYFTSVELDQSEFDTKFRVRLPKEMLWDKKYCWLFEFATAVVQVFERLNGILQQSKADLHEWYQQIFLHQKSLQNRLCDVKRQEKIFIKWKKWLKNLKTTNFMKIRPAVAELQKGTRDEANSRFSQFCESI